MVVLVPIVLLVIKRFDRVIGVGKPASPSIKEPSRWKEFLLETTNFRTAIFVGFGGGLLGLLSGGIFGALLFWGLVTVGIMVLSVISKMLAGMNERSDGLLLRLALGVPLGAGVGIVIYKVNNPDAPPTADGAGVGAFAGLALVLIWTLIQRWRGA